MLNAERWICHGKLLPVGIILRGSFRCASFEPTKLKILSKHNKNVAFFSLHLFLQFGCTIKEVSWHQEMILFYATNMRS